MVGPPARPPARRMPIRTSRRVDGNVPGEIVQFPIVVGGGVEPDEVVGGAAGGAADAAAGLAGAGGEDDGAGLGAPAGSGAAAPDGPVLAVDAKDSMQFDVPAEYLNRLGGVVKCVAGAVNVRWDLGTIGDADPLKAYLNDTFSVSLAEYLGDRKLVVPGAVAGINVLSGVECKAPLAQARARSSPWLQQERPWPRPSPSARGCPTRLGSKADLC